MRLFRPVELKAKELGWIATTFFTPFIDPAAAEFYDNLVAGGYEPDEMVKVLPRHKLIYIAVPKVASTRIRQTLATVAGRHTRSLQASRQARFRGPYGPRSMTKSSFFRLATNPETLRFSFVRNPYARTLSCWADKFRGKPLVPGDHYIGLYLALRPEIAADLPVGADQTLLFSQFVAFVSAVARSRCDVHIQAQHDILSMPGIELDFIGRVESFERDFARILDHLGASDVLRQGAMIPVNASNHNRLAAYYTPELADRVYRAYECDFDRFGYSRAIA